MLNEQRVPCPRNLVRGMPDQDMTNVPTTPYADGFSFNAALKYLPYRSFALLLGQLDELREQGHLYRARYLVIPFDVTIAIPQFETLDTTQNAAPGTILWGYNFAAVDGANTDFDVQVGDVCSGETYFENTIVSVGLRPTGASDQYPVLTEPRHLIGRPHPKLRITISNKTAGAKRCQLMLHLAEPCSTQERQIAPEGLPGWAT